MGANSFLYEMTQIFMDGNNELKMTELFPAKVYLFTLCPIPFQVTDNLVQSVKETDIHIISEEIFDHDPLTRLQNLKVLRLTFV